MKLIDIIVCSVNPIIFKYANRRQAFGARLFIFRISFKRIARFSVILKSCKIFTTLLLQPPCGGTRPACLKIKTTATCTANLILERNTEGEGRDHRSLERSSVPKSRYAAANTLATNGNVNKGFRAEHGAGFARV